MEKIKSISLYLLFVMTGFVLIGLVCIYHPGIAVDKQGGFQKQCFLLMGILLLTTIGMIRFLLSETYVKGSRFVSLILLQIALSIYVFFVVFLPAIGVNVLQVLE